MWVLDVLEILTLPDRLQRLPLTSTRLLQLLRCQRGSELRVFIFSQGNLATLNAAAEPGLVFRVIRKHPAKSLKDYVRPMQAIPCIQADYRDPGQALRGVRTLLPASRSASAASTILVAVPQGVFDALCARALPTMAGTSGDSGANAATADIRLLLEQTNDIKVPAELRNRFCGTAPAAELVRRLIMRAAATEHPVLIQGESGTGKEVVAREIHRLSGRRMETLFSVNCAGIPTELFESELFGHVKGSFSGAYRNKAGLWTLARTGTLFLDEIGELSRPHQAKVLRALEDGKFRPVGADFEIKSKARIIAATNRDLGRMVEQGQFREDLFYRLFVIRIRTPALREHPGDIPELANHFWRKICGNEAVPLSRDAERLLQNHTWPGNARELRAFLANVHALAGKPAFDLAIARVLFRDRGCVSGNAGDA